MDIDATIADLELKIERLRILYEQYFMGLEKAEPQVPRKEVQRLFAALQQEQIRNTALRFRLGMITHRWNSYAARWAKTMREIEGGTYSRHLARAQRKGVELPAEMQRLVHRAPAADRGPDQGEEPPRGPANLSEALAGVEAAPTPTTTTLPAAPAPPVVEDRRASPLPPPRPPERGARPLPQDHLAAPPLPPLRPLTPAAGAPPIAAPPTAAAAIPRSPLVRPTPAAPPTGAPLTAAAAPTTGPRPAPPGPPPSAGPPPAPPVAAAAPKVPGMSDPELRDLHRRYAAARGGPSVRYEHFVASLARQVPDILRQGSCREVTFDVEVREGRAVVKARPKK